MKETTKTVEAGHFVEPKVSVVALGFDRIDSGEQAGMSEDRARTRWPGGSMGLAILVGASIPLFFIGLGHPPLIEPDEPFYAVPALEMLKTGIWQVPVLHGAPWFDKPVLYYWLILAAYRVIGVTETATRIGSALAGLGGLLIVSRFDFGARSPSRSSSFVAAIVLGTCFEYMVLARSAVTDMTLTFFVTLGMAAVARLLVTERSRWAALAGAAFGLATLTKGPAGVILPGAGLVLYLALSRRTVLLRPSAIAAGAAGLLACAAPWYVYMAIAHRALLTNTFLGEGNLGRFMKPEHQQLPFFYLIVLALGMLPWSSLLPAAFADAVRPSSWKAEKAPGAPPGPLYALCWFAGILIVFSMSASELLTYILPAFPPAALLLGTYAVRAFEGARVQVRQARAVRALASEGEPPVAGAVPSTARSTPSRGLRLSAAAGVVFSVVIALVAIRGVSLGKWDVPDATVLAMASILVAGAVCAWIAVLRGSLPAFLSSHCLSAAGVILFGIATTGPYLAHFHSARTFVDALRTAGISDEVIGGYREKGFGVDFYLGRTLPRARNMKTLVSHVAANPGRIWVVPDTDLRTLASEPRLRSEAVASTPNFSAMRISPETP